MKGATKPTNGAGSAERVRNWLKGASTEAAPEPTESDAQTEDFQRLYWEEIAKRKEATAFLDPSGNVVTTTTRPNTAIGTPPKNGRILRRGELVCVRVCDIEEEEIDWLWKDRIPLGMLSLFSGDKGSGKSNLASMIASILSVGGPWPDDPDRKAPLGTTLYLNAEEHANSMFKPRLRRFGADQARVELVKAVKLPEDDTLSPFSLSADLQLLEDKIKALGDVKLVVVDTIASYLGSADAHKGGQVRQILDPVKVLAEKHNVAVILINHLNKGGGLKALYRSKDAIDIPNLCRATWMIAPDPDDTSRRLWLPNNSNIATGHAMAFRIEKDGAFEWDGDPIEGIDANSILAREAHILARAGKRGPAANKRKPCEAWIRKKLVNGPTLHHDLIVEGEKAGFSRSTINRALVAIKAPSLESDGVKFYQLPEDPKPTPELAL